MINGLMIFLMVYMFVFSTCARVFHMVYRQVSEEEGKELAKELGLMFMETSAKRGENVTMLFQQLASVLPGKEEKPVVQPDGIGFQLHGQEHRHEAETKKKKQCKC